MNRLKKFRQAAQEIAKKFNIFRIKKGAVLAGICKMIAEKFVLNVGIVRLFFVMISIFSFGLGLVVYLVLAWILPKKVANDPDYIDVKFREKKERVKID